MPKFIFRYESLLQHRRNLEDQAQRKMAERVRTQMILTDQLRGMQQQISDSKRDLGGALVGKVDLSQVGEFTRFNADSTVRGRQLVQRLAELKVQVEAARQQLVNAMQQRKALDLLRERDLKKWKTEQDRKETAELDDLASQAYTRKLFEAQRVVDDSSDTLNQERVA
ncbi:flagellar export protein FliJ [Algisphaera agarilytica]|uniref:Flagellar FliJ protein n=1 Tax=Algisphaera agarilytica TaxID=1385975 RepID=A0A7X0LKS3_9BACT|nr:flagellar export protein FliJ [Algisphaera agarilytica]MBB6430740.1 flagellar FliJ protein [Algisphaera agarilytica]